jgi:hypothetical protein
MMPTCVESQAPIPPSPYHRAQARSKDALHIDALTLVRALHLLAVCRFAVRLAHWRCPPPLAVACKCFTNAPLWAHEGVDRIPGERDQQRCW